MTRFFKWIDNLLFGGIRAKREAKLREAKVLETMVSQLITISGSLRTFLGESSQLLAKTGENLSAATQVLVRAMGAFERSDMAFAEIGSMADKMKAREAALEEALISIGKLKVEEAKVKALEAEELKLNLAAKPYDDKF